MVTLSYLDDEVSLTCATTGGACRPPGAAGRGRTADPAGLGLWAIQDRVESLGGRLVVERRGERNGARRDPPAADGWMNGMTVTGAA